MDEKKLKEILHDIDAPEPNETARKNAAKLALEAFEEKNQKNFQGYGKTDRPMGITNNIWRSMMKNRFKLSGLSGAVAACAVLAVIGVPIFTYNALDSQSIGQGGVVAVPEITNNTKLTEAKAIPVPKKERQVSADRLEAIETEQSVQADAAMAPPAAVVSRAASPQVQGFASNEIRMIVPPDIVQPGYKDVGQDEFTDFKDNSVKLVSEQPVSTFSIDVDTSSYSFMRRQLNNGVLPQKDAVRIEELINYFDYDYPVPETRDAPFEPTVAVYDSPWAEGKKLVHIGIKGYELDTSTKPRSNLVFLLDTSGSMNSADKLPLLINSFKLLLSAMDENDTVAIVTYAGSAGTVLEPTKVADKRKIIAALENLNAGGSTAGAAGIKQAYALAQESFDEKGVNRVILATDGDFNVGITNHEELQDYVERMRDTGISLSVLGFGQGNYHDNLMQTLAQNGNGQAAYIDTLSEARKVLVEQAASTLFTIAKDVKIQVEFNPANVSEYRLIGYETRHLNREDFNNDKVDAGEIGAGHAVTAIYEITPADSENRMVDDLRYGAAETEAETDMGDEYALLKIRYKKPDADLTNFADESELITRPVTKADETENASDDIRFAGAVAGFGQILRGGTYTGDYSYDDVISAAQSAKGEDNFGYRSEFINLVRLAKSADKME